MNRIIMLNDDLESQMRMYLGLCTHYRIEIAENEVALMRLIRRKRPRLLMLDAHHGNFIQSGKPASRLIEKIKHKYNRLRILTIVDGNDEHYGRSLEHCGADGWVDRLIDCDDLLLRVEQVLASSLPFTLKVAFTPKNEAATPMLGPSALSTRIEQRLPV